MHNDLGNIFYEDSICDLATRDNYVIINIISKLLHYIDNYIIVYFKSNKQFVRSKLLSFRNVIICKIA